MMPSTLLATSEPLTAYRLLLTAYCLLSCHLTRARTFALRSYLLLRLAVPAFFGLAKAFKARAAVVASAAPSKPR
jgi:hypothetical protein